MKKPSDESRLLFWLQQAHQTVRQRVNNAYKQKGHDTSTEQFSILSYLYWNENATQTDIATATQREKASVSRIISGLEKKGLIARTAIDRRTNRVTLTEEGALHYQLLSPISDAVANEILNLYSDKDIATTIKILKLLASE